MRNMANMSRKRQTRQARLLMPGDVIFDTPQKYTVREVQNKRDGMTRVLVKEHGKEEKWIVYGWSDRVRLY